MRGSPAGVLLLVLALGSGQAGADDAPAPSGPADDPAAVIPEWDLKDGKVRVIVQPEFREALDLRTDLLALGLPGLQVELVTPVVVRPTPLDDKRPPQRSPSRVLLIGPKPVVDKARAHIERLDAPPRMASVSLLISEVRLTGADATGSSLLFDKDGIGDPKGTLFRTFETGFTPDRFLITSLTGARPFEGNTLTLGDSNVLGGAWETTLRMLAKRGDAQFLAWPNLLCAEGRRAEIQALENLPHIRLESAGASRRVRVTSEQVGLRLGVTALRVGAEHAVLDIDLWLTVPEAADSARSALSGIVLNTRQVRTRVTVRDGEPLLIGGLFLRRYGRKRKGLPRIEGLSLVDHLLFAEDRDCVDTELVMLVRARVRTPQRGAKPTTYDPFLDRWPTAGEKSPAAPKQACVPTAAPQGAADRGAPASSADLDPPPGG